MQKVLKTSKGQKGGGENINERYPTSTLNFKEKSS